MEVTAMDRGHVGNSSVAADSGNALRANRLPSTKARRAAGLCMVEGVLLGAETLAITV
jgi:hypothetical protein